MGLVKLSELIAPHFQKDFLSKKTYQIFSGGRNSTKTSMSVLKIIYHLLIENKCSAVIMRRHQKELRNSVFKEMKRGCRRFGLVENVDYFCKYSNLEIRFNNGNAVYFAGGDDYETVKGMIDENNPIKIIWFEEANNFENIEVIDQILATFSRGNNDWFISMFSYNPPKNKYSWINKWAEDKKKEEDTLFNHSTYLTVPKDWVGEKALKIAEDLKKNDLKRYKWIYLGEVQGIDGLIFNPDLIQEIDTLDENERIISIDFAIDSGHQTSATVYLAIGKTAQDKYILLDTFYYSPNEKQIKKSPSELSQHYHEFKIQLIKKYRCNIDDEVIDSAEGALRNQVFYDYGTRLNPVAKDKKSILIDFTQNFIAQKNFFVLNNTNNKIFLEELKNYSYIDSTLNTDDPKIDKAEKNIRFNYKNSYTNENIYTFADHSMDAFQYWVKNNLRKLRLKF